MCLAAFAGGALLDVFVLEHESNEDIIVESIDFGGGSAQSNSSLKETNSKATSKATSSTSNKNNKDTSKATSNVTDDNDISSPTTPSAVLSEADRIALSKAISVTK